VSWRRWPWRRGEKKGDGKSPCNTGEKKKKKTLSGRSGLSFVAVRRGVNALWWKGGKRFEKIIERRGVNTPRAKRGGEEVSFS